MRKMRLSTGRQILTFLGAGLALLIIMSVVAHKNITLLSSAAEQRKYTDEVLDTLGSMLSHLKDVQAGHRGYAVTGRESYLATHRAATRKIGRELDLFKKLTADEPLQQERLKRLEPAIDRGLRFSQRVIDARKTGGRDAAFALLRRGTDQRQMVDMQSVIADLEREEKQRLKRWDELLTARTGRAVTIILLGNLGTLAVFLFFGFITHQEFLERRQTEKALGETEEQLQMLVEGVKDYSIMMLDPEGRVISCTAGMETTSGFCLSDIIGKQFSLFYPAEDVRLGRPEQALKTAVADGRFEEDGWRVHKDGSRFWANVVITAMRDEAGKLRGFSEVTRDISERRRAEESMKKLSMSVEQATDLIVLTDVDGKIEYINKAVEEISGYAKEELMGKSRDVWESGLNEEKLLTEMWETVRSGRPFHAIFTNRRKDGELFYLYEVITPLKDVHENITHLVTTGRDITQQKVLEERLDHLAYYDALTGIPNRTLFVDRLSQGIARSQYSKKIIAVLAVDIDLFKFINEAYGFTVGDDVLKAVTKRLLESVRAGDTVARLGSDDFGILLLDVAETEDIILVVKKIMETISLSLKVQGEEIVLTAGVGIAVYPNDGQDAQDIMKSVDIALSKAKQQGRNNYQFYTKDMTLKAMEFVSVDKSLLKSFQNREFMVYYQPYWDVVDRKMVGMEALIRWNSADRGVILPDKFISVLEDTGMIIEVGDWIIRAVCRQLGEWKEKGYPVVPVSVNVSSVQFRRKDLAEKIMKTVDECKIDPRLLTLEITESTFIQNVEYASLALKKLKERGITTSLDDFGTGYSSLSYLKRFPFDNLKIDISFVRDLSVDTDAASIVTAIIALAHSLNLKTIAEGVETEDLLKILRLLKCDMAQGDYFSPPLPAKGVEIFFE
jgi:diguanylate cyclase (GGDEF)-like protein/PAS domain S-box-containing protein